MTSRLLFTTGLWGRFSLRAVLRAWLTLLRIRATSSAAVITILASFIQNRTPGQTLRIDSQTIKYAAIAFLVIAFAQITNDILDRALDAIAKPHRPIPSGSITVRTAILASVACATAALAVATSIGHRIMILVVIALSLSMSYSFRLKGIVVLGSFVVALVCTSMFAIPWIAKGSFDSVAISTGSLVFFFILGNEMFKTAIDIDGDRAASVRTLATVYGIRTTAWAIVGCWTCITFTYAMFLQGLTTLAVGWIGIITVVIPTGIAAAFALHEAWCIGALARSHNWWRIGWLGGFVWLLLWVVTGS